MNDKQEAIADIIAEMRGFKRYAASDSSDCRYVAYWLYQTFADRLETAYKHEREGWEGAACSVISDAFQSGKIAVVNEAQSNGAKLREALEFADKELRRATEDDRFGEDLVYLVGCMRTVAAVCRDALAAPSRNCDRFKTLEDALAAWREVSPAESGPFDEWLFAEVKGDAK